MLSVVLPIGWTLTDVHMVMRSCLDLANFIACAEVQVPWVPMPELGFHSNGVPKFGNVTLPSDKQEPARPAAVDTWHGGGTEAMVGRSRALLVGLNTSTGSTQCKCKAEVRKVVSEGLFYTCFGSRHWRLGWINDENDDRR